MAILLFTAGFVGVSTGFKYRGSAPGKIYGGYIWNTAGTGYAGIRLMTGVAPDIDTVDVLFRNGTYFINTPGPVVFGDSTTYFAGVFNKDTLTQDITLLYVYGQAEGKAPGGGSNTAMLSLGVQYGVSGLANTQMSYQYDSLLTGYVQSVSEGGWLISAWGGASTIYLDTLNKLGVGTPSPRVALDVYGSDAIGVPVGNTADRPTGAEGFIRYNTDSSAVEYWNGTAWDAID